MSAWLTVIGLGEDGVDALAPAARALLEGAEVLVAGERHFALVGEHPAERLGWQFPLEPLMAELEARRGRRVVVLATGDPMCFGIGSTLARYLDAAELRVLPAPSAFSLACARLGWPRHGVETLTLHGRPLELVNGWLMPGQRLLLLANDGATPAALAAAITGRGFGASRLVVLEHMGGVKERRLEATAESWAEERKAPRIMPPQIRPSAPSLPIT